MASPASQVIQRVIAAAFGGYVLTAASSACLSYALVYGPSMSRFDATMTGLLIGFLIYAAVIMWVFAAHSLKRMWWQLGSATAVFTVLAVLLSPQLVLP